MQLELFHDNDYTQHKKYQNGTFKTKKEIIDFLKNEGKTDIYYVLSFGGGTQSTHLLEEHFKGNIYYDYIVFSDTGAEPQFIHEQVKWWKERQKQYRNTTPFIITSHNSMKQGLEEMLMRYILTDYQRFQMPLYFSKFDKNGNEVAAGMTPRQCTIDFKILPVKQTVRYEIMKKYGLSPKQRFPKNVAILQDIGFSFDEINRVSAWQSPQYKYIYMAYPLIERGLTTQDSIEYLEINKFPCKRSRCYFCPFNCASEREIKMDWEEIIREEPLSFLKAVWFDDELRKVVKSGKKRLQSIPYFHYSRQPLRNVFQEEFELIKSKYSNEFNIWLSEWIQFIHKKYQY